MSKKLLVAVVLLISIAGLFVYLAIRAYTPEVDGISRSDYGVIGDYFGGVLNPSFAFLSFLALLATISLQVKELEAQRNELRMTRNEMKESKHAQEKSAGELRLQNQLQIHAVRTNALSSLIEAASFEARNADTEQGRQESLEEMQVYARQLEAEVEAVTTLIPEATDRVRSAEEELFGFSSQ